MTMRPDSLAIARLGELLRRETGQTLAEGRHWRIETLLRPVLRARGLGSLDDLLRAIENAGESAGDSTLKAEVIDAMLNHESSFFRDLAVFRMIEDVLLPRLASRRGEKSLRIWCAGCSTGQEAYSLAMIVRRMKALEGWHVAIHASDVSAPVIAQARRGRYAQMDMQRGLPIGDLLRWFRPADKGWQIADEIREMVSFHVDNLLEPRRIAGPFDLILCRNVLFYFPEAARRQACDQMARRARRGAFLVLGAGEMLGAHAAFSPSRALNCVYVAGSPDDAAQAFPADASSARAIGLGTVSPC